MSDMPTSRPSGNSLEVRNTRAVIRAYSDFTFPPGQCSVILVSAGIELR